MRTVPLHGKKAAGRVALVDDQDYDLVMQYRWYVYEPEPKPGCRKKGPYAVTNSYAAGRHRVIRMHCLIMDAKGVDHQDHDGLNNQRSNLRVATGSQNNQNQRPRLEGTTSSRFKGVCEVRPGWWRAYADRDGCRYSPGEFPSELEAAYAYDATARELFGEFACTNFPAGPAQAMRDQWQAEREARSAVVMAVARQAQVEGMKQWWDKQEYRTCICVECGSEFQTRMRGEALRCSKECRQAAATRQKRQRRAGKRLRGEKVT